MKVVLIGDVDVGRNFGIKIDPILAGTRAELIRTDIYVNMNGRLVPGAEISIIGSMRHADPVTVPLDVLRLAR